MEKFKAILKARQDQYDDLRSREALNRLIVQRTIDKKIRDVGRQRLFLSILINLAIFIGLVAIFYGLKDPVRKIYIEEMQVSTWIIIVGVSVLFNLTQKVLQVLRFER